MAKGISLHVGIDEASHAFPNAPVLKGCKNDARAMRDIAALRGFSQSELLLDGKAKYDSVKNAISAAAAALVAGDIFLFTFAGHGSGVPDIDRDEPDGQDETILLFDYMLIDDVLGRELWPLFKRDVRILVVSDSCHSGTFLVASAATRVRKSERLSLGSLERSVTTEITTAGADGPLVRTISEAVRDRHLWEHREFYLKVLNALPPVSTAPPLKPAYFCWPPAGMTRRPATGLMAFSPRLSLMSGTAARSPGTMRSLRPPSAAVFRLTDSSIRSSITPGGPTRTS